MPHDNCRLSDVRIFVDGKEVKTRLSGSDRPVYLHQAIQISFGSLANSLSCYNALDVHPFEGEMDEISIWARPLDDKETSALAEQ